MKKYDIVEKIGQGSFGAVFKARDRTTDNIVAMKVLKEEGDSRLVRREIGLLKRAKHPNVVTLLEEVHEGSTFYLIMECFPQTLAEQLRRLPSGQMLAPRLVKSYMYQLTSALKYCHRKLIMHRDVKPSNLLVNAEGVLKVADFGLACSFAVAESFSRVGTRPYKAPEILMGSRTYSCAVDIWSIGCVFAEMALRKCLFFSTNDIIQLYFIFCVLGTPTEESWSGVTSLPYYQSSYPRWIGNKLSDWVGLHLAGTGLDLLHQCVEYNPAARITAEGMLAHPFFKG